MTVIYIEPQQPISEIVVNTAEPSAPITERASVSARCGSREFRFSTVPGRPESVLLKVDGRKIALSDDELKRHLSTRNPATRTWRCTASGAVLHSYRLIPDSGAVKVEETKAYVTSTGRLTSAPVQTVDLSTASYIYADEPPG